MILNVKTLFVPNEGERKRKRERIRKEERERKRERERERERELTHKFADSNEGLVRETVEIGAELKGERHRVLPRKRR